MNTYYIRRINFKKDYQKDSYNKNILIKKIKRIKKLLTKFKKDSYPKICGILKL